MTRSPIGLDTRQRRRVRSYSDKWCDIYGRMLDMRVIVAGQSLRIIRSDKTFVCGFGLLQSDV